MPDREARPSIFELTIEPSSVEESAARHFLRAAVRVRGGAFETGAVETLADDAVSDAVEHADRGARVTIDCPDGDVRLTVVNHAPDTTGTRAEPSAEDVALHLIEEVAASWGVDDIGHEDRVLPQVIDLTTEDRSSSSPR
jgi:hypothetical protein